MKEYLKRWNFMRILRLVLGVIIVVQGVQTQEWLFVILGGMFSVLALLNLSTCGISNSACRTPMNTDSKHKTDDITYEEIK